MIKRLIVLVALLAAAPLHAARSAEDEGMALIGRAMNGDHRDPAFIERDRFRHPAESLLFFGWEPSMTVVEIWPRTG